MKGGDNDKGTQLLGIALVFANLSLDGWTNATQVRFSLPSLDLSLPLQCNS